MKLIFNNFYNCGEWCSTEGGEHHCVNVPIPQLETYPASTKIFFPLQPSTVQIDKAKNSYFLSEDLAFKSAPLFLSKAQSEVVLTISIS